MNQRLARRWYWMPVAVFLLGMLSSSLLIWINAMNERQDENFIFADMVMDVQLRATISHLWLEEFLSGETGIDMDMVWTGFDQSISLADAVLNGGESEHGMHVEPIRDPDLRLQVQTVQSLMKKFKDLALERYQDPTTSGVGTVQDEAFDDLFREILGVAGALEENAEKKQAVIKVQSRRLFMGILLVWAAITMAATVGIWNREAKKNLAERALHDAYNELERRVESRTADLSAANKHLKWEIGERKRAEEGIRLYEEVVKNMPIGLYVWSLENVGDMEMFRLVAANPVADRVTGVTTENILGKVMTDGFLDTLETGIHEIHSEVIRSGEEKNLDIHYKDKGGTDGFFAVKAFPLPNRCVGVMFENITDRKNAEDALRESEAKFRKLSQEFHTLLDAVPDSITLLSPDLEILWANRGAARAANKDLDDMTGKYCHEVWGKLSTPCADCPARKSFVTGKMETATVSASNGTFWDLRAFPIQNEDGETSNVLELATDITEKIALQAEAMRAAHLASIGELAAGVAHEINNPINGIINCAEILSEESERGSRENDIANRIIREGARVASIVSGLLSFARARKEEKEPVHVADILTDCLDLTESLLRKNGIRVLLNVPPDLPETIANSQQIQQVFLNIINNAGYALNEKYPGEHENKVIEILCEQQDIDGNPHLRISFSDHGTGIPRDMIGKIMSPFFSTKPVGKGTGLGLSVSHGIISDHGGRLTVNSTEGEFTRVEILLPAMKKAERWQTSS